MRLVLRPEERRDHRAVEVLTRDAFWGTSGPRCDEHLLVRRLRSAPSFVRELDVVAEEDGELVGHVVYSRAWVQGPRARHEVLTFGPLSVLPSHQGQGVGSALMRHTLARAARLGHRAVVVYGHPDYYPRFGFVRAASVGITAPGGATFDALMALALTAGGLDGVHGEFHEDPVFRLDPSEVAAFDATFPARADAPAQPLAGLAGQVPDRLLVALRARGIDDLRGLRRFSRAELSAWPGVGSDGADLLRDLVLTPRAR
ncbi:N-acetyltransferase [Isoptericola sp. b441]|uniref:N-acetyltransferase n=1 Tax=Actinotalea lenta TaxID=3064654 RepID=A0ABT9D6B9_9CELL|nr:MULTISPECIES: N-acetyltransferase [unclassified Isoptericola]MDO8106379.1 N-acetyltransferase [Isoptericola sp. b441]MDO8121902.1 N-acetyltransferase [Isoptericola sp. b490]